MGKSGRRLLKQVQVQYLAQCSPIFVSIFVKNRCECKAIFVSTDPVKVEGAVDCQEVNCTTGCSHVGKQYQVGRFNDGCNDCICDEFGGVTCTTVKPTESSGISPRIIPGCVQINSVDPLLVSSVGVDLEANSRINFEKDSAKTPTFVSDREEIVVKSVKSIL